MIGWWPAAPSILAASGDDIGRLLFSGPPPASGIWAIRYKTWA